MTCYHPLQAWRARGGIVFSRNQGIGTQVPITIPCGQCIGCRLERSRQWAMRCMHEAKLHDDNCFLTLTYSPEKTPANGSLVLEDLQGFLKRYRSRIFPATLRFYAAGEYGDKNNRPHYHICIFGHDFKDKAPLRRSPSGEMLYRSDTLESLWPDGYSSIGAFSFKTAAYCARYIIGKSTGPEAIRYQEGYIDPTTGEVFGARRPPFNTMSRRPGLGRSFALKYMTDIFPSDYMILDGQKVQPPRYYDTVAETVGINVPHYKLKRKAKSRLHKADQTPERLAVREICKQAQLKRLRRNLED